MNGSTANSSVEQAISRHSQLIALPSFVDSLLDLKRRRPDLLERLARHIESFGAGTEQQRTRLKGSNPPRFRTRVADDCRLIDEPLSGELSGHVALLHVDTRDRVYRWSDNNRGSSADIARRVLEERARAAEERGRAPSGQSVVREAAALYYGARYGSLMSAADLERLGIPASKREAVLDAGVGLIPASPKLSRAVREQIDKRFEELRQRGRREPGYAGRSTDECLVGTPSEIARAIRAPLTTFLLALSEEQRTIVRRKSEELLIVKGAAGSGKTIIGLHRIKHWLSEPDLFQKPMLFTCYNNVLAHSAEQLLRDVLRGEVNGERVVVKTAYKLLLALVRELEPGWEPRLVGESQLLPAIRRARKTANLTPRLRRWSDTAVLREIIDVIYARALLKREQYLTADRSGSGRALAMSTSEDRPAFWTLYQAVRKDWAANRIAPWEVVPAHLVGLLEKQPPKEPRFHGIVVDEVQDLTPSVIRALTLLQGAQAQRRMVLLGDAAQSVYRSPFRWKHAGVDGRGHTEKLQHCYRCTPRILQAAVPLVASQGERFEDDLVLPMASGDPGPKVRMILANTDGAEAEWLCDTIEERLQDGANVATIGVLSNAKAVRQRVRDRLQERGIPSVEYEGGSEKKLAQLDEPAVKVLTISSAKGIEFPIVFLPGITEQNFPTTGEDEEAIDRARRVLYTAITRAGRELYLSATHTDASQLLASGIAVEHVD
jgi:superfamily I DNA/RNA helicase/mRNA-degrading endonuclease RelE of RelBE toxin-antitoxin system